MRILITGGAGLLGRALAKSLTGDGHVVIALSRHPEQVRGLPAGASAAHWDGRTTAGWAHLADGVDAIFNMAGANIGARRWTPERLQTLRESRIHAGTAVVQAVELATHKPGVVFQSSGIGYYGDRGDDPVTEEVGPGTDVIARLAVEWEASTALVENWGVRRVVTRSAPVLTTAGGFLPPIAQAVRFCLGGRLGSGRQWVPWVHIEDQVRALRFLLDSPNLHGPFNLVALDQCRNRDFVRALGRVLHRPTPWVIPAPVLRLLFGQRSMLFLTGQRAFPHELLAAGFVFRFPKLQGALENLFRRSG